MKKETTLQKAKRILKKAGFSYYSLKQVLKDGERKRLRISQRSVKVKRVRPAMDKKTSRTRKNTR